MVSYAIKWEKKRLTVIAIIALIALFAQKIELTSIFCYFLKVIGINGFTMEFKLHINYMAWIGILYWFYNGFLWIWLYEWHKIPNLNGDWQVSVKRKVEETGEQQEVGEQQEAGEQQETVMKTKIKQKWDKIDIRTTFKTGKTKATIVSIDEEEMTLNYSYCNEVNLEKTEYYVGYNELKINLEGKEKQIEGNYFTSKKTNGSFRLTKINEKSKYIRMIGGIIGFIVGLALFIFLDTGVSI